MLQKIRNQIQKLLQALRGKLRNKTLLQPVKTYSKALKEVFSQRKVVKEADAFHSAEQKIKKALAQKIALAATAVLLAVAMVVAMTAAWFSNVIQATNLTFEVNNWGLNSTVQIGDKLLQAAPGDSGILDLEVFNAADSIVEVELSVGKNGLYNGMADMRKRLYFYIEDTVVRGEETTPRVYLNSQEVYKYTLLAKQTLLLGQAGSHAALKWAWVYDVLGYYFYGAVNEVSAAQIHEYLRPIEYDFDAATFTGDRLTQVDGVDTQAFMAELTSADGYVGRAGDPVTDAEGRVFYPLAVDQNGVGVWAYLCTLREIEQENAVDTALGSIAEAEKRQFSTTLNVVAQQKKLTVANVGTAEDLAAALGDDQHNMVVLQQDVTLDERITLSGDAEKVLDLGGHTLSTTQTGNLVLLQNGGSMSVLNGTIQCPENHSSALFTVYSGDLALSGVTVEQAHRSLVIEDQKGAAGDSHVSITDCTLYGKDLGILIRGNGKTTAVETYLTIQNSKIESPGTYALSGSGNATQSGTKIRIIDSSLQALYTAVYHPQGGQMEITNSSLKALTPLVVKGGAVTVQECKIEADFGETAQQMIMQPAFNGSGFADTGAAVYVETSYNKPTSVTLQGNNEVTAHYQQAVLLYETDNPNYTLTVTGGSYSHDVSAFLPQGYTCKQVEERFVVEATE